MSNDEQHRQRMIGVLSVFAIDGTKTSSKHSHKDLQQNTVIIPSTTKKYTTVWCHFLQTPLAITPNTLGEDIINTDPTKSQHKRFRCHYRPSPRPSNWTPWSQRKVLSKKPSLNKWKDIDKLTHLQTLTWPYPSP
jgi:hypothetical protein